MRLSLAISLPPAWSGTLKSARINTVLSFKSRSLIDNLGTESLYETGFHWRPRVHAPDCDRDSDKTALLSTNKTCGNFGNSPTVLLDKQFFRLCGMKRAGENFGLEL